MLLTQWMQIAEYAAPAKSGGHNSGRTNYLLKVLEPQQTTPVERTAAELEDAARRCGSVGMRSFAMLLGPTCGIWSRGGATECAEWKIISMTAWMAMSSTMSSTRC